MEVFLKKICENFVWTLETVRNREVSVPRGSTVLIFGHVIRGAIHSTKIPTGPTGKTGPPQKEDQFFRNFSGHTEPIH